MQVVQGPGAGHARVECICCFDTERAAGVQQGWGGEQVWGNGGGGAGREDVCVDLDAEFGGEECEGAGEGGDVWHDGVEGAGVGDEGSFFGGEWGGTFEDLCRWVILGGFGAVGSEALGIASGCRRGCCAGIRWWRHFPS